MSFDEMYDEMLHDEFRSSGSSRGKHAAPEVAEEEHEGPRGLSRYRNAVMVGAGGLGCAAVGALLGGLGGYFTVNPAAAHSVASSSSQDQRLADAVNQAYRASAQQSGSAAVAAASFSALSGSLTQGIAPFQTLSYHSPVNLPVLALPVGAAGSAGSGGSGSGGNGANGGGSGSGTGGGGAGCTASQGDLGLSCILDSLTSMLGSLQGNPTGALNGLVPTLSGVVADVTGALANLGSLLPTSSLPLPTTGLPTTGLGTLSATVPAATGGRSPVPGTSVGGLTPVLNGIAAAVGGATGSTTPSLPSLPLASGGGSTPTLPSLPITTPGGSLPAPPTVGTPGAPTSGGQTNINVPVPSLPVPVNPPVISIGGISVGVSSSGSNPGLSLSLP
jgi:hypothetical protein